MLTIIQISLLLPLFLFSLIDIKYKKIPSIMLTGTLFVYAVVNINNLPLGILAFIFAYLLYEMDFFGGVADIKILTTMGLMFDSIFMIFALMVLVPLIGTIYKILVKKFIKKTSWAFIPCLMVIYFILLAIGGAWF